jgi:hypothetical protein
MNFFGVPSVENTMNLALLTLSLAFGGITTGILAVQRRAKTCTHHDHAAGKAALALAGVCGLIALAVLVGAFLL